MKHYRKLTLQEIEILKNQMCTASDWSLIEVSGDFSPEYVHYTRFSGNIRIGSFRKEFSLSGGMKKHSGLFYTTLHNVTIGDDCFIGPNVSIYTACHSTDPVERNTRREWAEPVTIGDNVWIGGSVTILPGVSIGNNVTIGAGSVVTKDIPDNVVAVGNPCKVIKNL